MMTPDPSSASLEPGGQAVPAEREAGEPLAAAPQTKRLDVDDGGRHGGGRHAKQSGGAIDDPFLIELRQGLGVGPRPPASQA